MQGTYFKNEIMRLTRNESLSKISSLFNLDPFFDNGLIIIEGRLQNSLLSYDNKHPLILPSESNLSRLLIQSIYIRTMHGGTRLTVAILRQNY